MDTAHTETEKPSDSELFACPWDASVIVKAYQDLGARGEGGGGKRRRKKKEDGGKMHMALIKLYQELP